MLYFKELYNSNVIPAILGTGEKERECELKSLHFYCTWERESMNITKLQSFQSLFLWNYENSPT